MPEFIKGKIYEIKRLDTRKANESKFKGEFIKEYRHYYLFKNIKTMLNVTILKNAVICKSYAFKKAS